MRLRPTLLTLVTSAALVAPLSANAACPTRAAWPTAGWTAHTEDVAKSRAAELKALEDYAFTLTGKDEERKGIRTDGVVIIRGGELIYERYARGFSEKNRHLGWSVTKTATTALTGVAVAKGAVALDDSLCKYVKATNQENCVVTVKNLLEFGTGISWKESYEGESNQVSSVLAMLYGEGRKDMAAFVTSHERRSKPGESYSYSTGDSTLLASVVNRAMLAAGFGPDWPHEQLFDVIGMSNATLERDAAGNPVGGSYLYATPRDFAKFGFFLLNDGCWEGKQVLPEGWVKTATTPNEAFLKGKHIDTDSDDVHGWQIWLNRPVPELGIAKPYPDLPEDAYAARGHWGQSITVLPSQDTIVVRVADDRDGESFDFNKFVSLAMAVAKP